LRLRASAKASELSEISVRALDSGAVLIEGRQVPMSKLARWMSEVRQETRSQWGDWSIEREAEAGLVQVRIRFVELAPKAS
jgi:type II secretory pathway component PulM